jgi:predicted DNA binding CopG/RHH family protein
VQSGENLGGFTLKQPKINEIKIDLNGTEKMRARMAKAKKIKITVNIDEDLLTALKLRSEDSGVPYQVILNKLLRSSLEKQIPSEAQSRLDRLEKEVAKLKRSISA